MKKLNYFLIILIFFFLTSCVTNEDNIYLDSTPTWINIDYNNDVSNFYIIKGEGYSSKAATYDAIYKFYNTLSKSILIENKKVFIDDLDSNFVYEPLKMKIEKSYINNNDDNIYSITYLVSAEKKLIEDQKLKKENLELQNTNDLLNYENLSNKYYRNNKDLDSIKVLIDAYIFAKNHNYEEKAKNYLNSIISRISDINITIFSKNNINNLELKVYREENFIDPIVLNTQLIASYNNIDIDYKNYLSQEVIYPFKDGSYEFNIDVKKNNEEGIIIFKLNLQDQINLLIKNNFIEAKEQIEKAINEKVFAYKKDLMFENKIIYIKTIENDDKQKPLDSVSIDFFKKKLESFGATVIINQDINLENIDSLNNKGDYFFLFRAEIVEKKEDYKSVVLSHGSLEIYDLKDSNLVYDSTLIDSLYIGNSIKESQSQSILKVARKVFHSFLR